MRILWINHRCPKHPEAGGAEVHIAEVGKRLVKKGHEVTLLTERFDGSKPEEELYGMKVKRFGGKFTLHAYAPCFVKRNSKNFDVIIDDIAHAVPFWSPKFTRKPVAAIVHHVHQKVVERELPYVLRYLVKRAERSIKGTYRNIVAVSQTTKKDLIEQFGVEDSRINVIHHGIDHAKYRQGLRFDEPTIVWIGRMKKYKNLDHLIEAFKLVKERVKNAKLILVGKGEEEKRIRLLAHEMKLSDVKFTGWIPESEKVRILQGAWCIAYTSDVEGWGMGVIEANACGTPAIAYNSKALREVIIDGKTGLLVEYGDVYNLAEKLIEFIQDEGLMRRLSEGALKYSCNFNWEKTAAQTEDYLKCLI